MTDKAPALFAVVILISVGLYSGLDTLAGRASLVLGLFVGAVTLWRD